MNQQFFSGIITGFVFAALNASILHAAPAPQLSPSPATPIQIAQLSTPAPAAVAAEPPDLAKYKSADELWAYIEELAGQPQITSRSAATAYATNFLAALDEFAKRYPHDPRRWAVKLIRLDVTGLQAQLRGETLDVTNQEPTIQEVASASDAPADVKADARFFLIRIHVSKAGDEKLSSEAETEINNFQKDFPDDPRNAPLQLYRVKTIAKTDPARSEKLLSEMAAGSNQVVARMAQAQINLKELPKKPLELKFKALDGSDVDVSKLRGKVVLIDFWATWCAPCMMELPHVVQIYKRLHDRGFEIIGISLDEAQDRDKLLKVLKENDVTWPQSFDGKGPETEIAARYAIEIVPTMWLVNKKGYVVNTNVRENLESEAEKLLAE